MESDSSVDIIVPPGEKIPFDDGSIVSTSYFEHDPCFWLTFKEMTKPSGFIYINGPIIIIPEITGVFTLMLDKHYHFGLENKYPMKKFIQ